MAAPTLVAAYVSAINPIGGSATLTSSSLSLQAGDVVTVLAVGAGANTGDHFNTPTTTFANGGITAVKTHSSASDCQAGAWTFTVSTTGSGTVSVQVVMGNSNTDNAFNFAVIAHRGASAPTATTSALGTGTSKTVAYTASQADSAIAWILGDWNAGTAGTATPTSTSHNSTTPGPTALPQSSLLSGQYTENVAVLDDQTSTASVSYGVTGTSSTGPFTIIVVEIPGTASSGGATVNALKATTSVAAVAPVVSGIQNATVTAVAATVSVAAVAPTVSSAVNGTVNAVAATATLAAVAPAVSAGASVAAVKATLASAAVAPAIQSGSTVTAVKATATTAAVAPTVAGGASVSAVKATVSSAAAAPSASGGAVVTAVVATVSVAALAPVVSATSPGTILAVAAHVTVAANAPTVSGGAKVTAVKATVSTAAVAPTVALGATVSAVAATVAISALAPSVSTPDAVVQAVRASLSLSAYAPRVSAVALVPIFRTPTFGMHYIDREEPLIVRIPIPTAYSILKQGGYYQQVLSPTDEEISAAEIAYLGGRDYVLTPSEQNALTAAGYGAFITIQEVVQ